MLVGAPEQWPSSPANTVVSLKEIMRVRLIPAMPSQVDGRGSGGLWNCRSSVWWNLGGDGHWATKTGILRKKEDGSSRAHWERHVPSHYSQRTFIVSQKRHTWACKTCSQVVLQSPTRNNPTSRHLRSDWTLCLAQRIGSILPELWGVAVMDSTPGLSSF